MPIHLIGGETGGPAFQRSFFATTLGEILAKSGNPSGFRLSLFLADGSELDICNIEDLTEEYVVLRRYQEEDRCSTALDFIPYGLIYRVQLSPKESEDGERVGFQWVQPPEGKKPAGK